MYLLVHEELSWCLNLRVTSSLNFGLKRCLHFFQQGKVSAHFKSFDARILLCLNLKVLLNLTNEILIDCLLRYVAWINDILHRRLILMKGSLLLRCVLVFCRVSGWIHKWSWWGYLRFVFLSMESILEGVMLMGGMVKCIFWCTKSYHDVLI